MDSESKAKVLKTNPQLVKRFHVWLNHCYLVMPNGFKKQVKKGNFYTYIRKNYEPDLRVREMDYNEFINFAHGFVNFTYANILGFYYEMDLLINLVDGLNSEFSPFMKILNDGIKNRQGK